VYIGSLITVKLINRDQIDFPINTVCVGLSYGTHGNKVENNSYDQFPNPLRKS
jgi:hypothetical protein